MGNILVVAEQRDGALKKVTLEAVSTAAKLGDKVEVVLIGSGVKGLTDELGKYGADKVYVADDASLANYTSDGYADIAASIVEKAQPALVLMGASLYGRDIAGRLAAKFKAGIAADCVEVNADGDDFIFKRPVYSGKAFAMTKIKSAVKIATIRPNVFAMEEAGKSAEVEDISVSVSPKAQVKEFVKTGGEEISLTEANIIVSGGRGVKSAENFKKVIYPLANALKAAVGASRAAVDSEYIDYSHQVGQTGKVVSPTLYIACGISGAIQHLAGMGSSKYIAAINRDEEAPIFKVATYGVVGDLFEVVPALTEIAEKELG